MKNIFRRIKELRRHYWKLSSFDGNIKRLTNIMQEHREKFRSLEKDHSMLMSWVEDVNHDLKVLDKLSPDTIYNKRLRKRSR